MTDTAGITLPIPGDRIEFLELVNNVHEVHRGRVTKMSYELGGAVIATVRCDDDIWRTAELVAPFSILNNQEA